MTHATLLETLLKRRSRRFSRNRQLVDGPLAFSSDQTPVRLTLEQEALLAFAAVGITGPALGEMEYTSGTRDSGGGNVMAGFIGRTAASADALQSVGLVVINDEGAWYIPRPQDLNAESLRELAALVDARDFTRWYERIRVRISERRVTIPAEMPFTPPFNRWDTNKPGTTVFLPIIETTALFINCLLTALSEEMGIFIIDDGLNEQQQAFQPAGLAEFARTNPVKPGHLRSDAKEIGFVVPLSLFETVLLQSVSAEVGGIVQNLALMAQALRLGGFTHAAQHPEWLTRLGFRDTRADFQDMMGVGQVSQETLEQLGYAAGVPTFTFSSSLMRSYCPPLFPTMSDAVDAFVQMKYGSDGIFRGGAAPAWNDARAVEKGISAYSANAIAATKSYCEYVFAKYKRFPTLCGPVSTLLAYQAHHLDNYFYERFYQPGVLP